MFPDAGRILLDGEVISFPVMKPTDFEKYRKRFGILFQGAALFDSMNVGENLFYSPARAYKEFADQGIRKTVGESLEKKSALRRDLKPRCLPNSLAACAAG